MLTLLHVVAKVSLAGMALVPAGSYRPLYSTADHARVSVAAFALDREPVTRGDYLRFVRLHASWRKSNAARALTEDAYLGDWGSDLEPGRSELADPVTSVSWFAAEAYCAPKGKRLPTTDEWELAAAASEMRRDATDDPRFLQRLVELYSTRAGGFRNLYGVSGLVGHGWEWTLDYNSSAPSGGHEQHQQLDHAAMGHDPSCAGAAMGATDATNYPAFLRSAFRAGLTPRSTVRNLGFRCAAGLPA